MTIRQGRPMCYVHKDVAAMYVHKETMVPMCADCADMVKAEAEHLLKIEFEDLLHPIMGSEYIGSHSEVVDQFNLPASSTRVRCQTHGHYKRAASHYTEQGQHYCIECVRRIEQQDAYGGERTLHPLYEEPDYDTSGT